MQIHVNGQPRTLERTASVTELLAQLDLDPRRVAVEINEDLVPRKQFAETTVRDGDQVEIVTFVGGG